MKIVCFCLLFSVNKSNPVAYRAPAKLLLNFFSPGYHQTWANRGKKDQI